MKEIIIIATLFVATQSKSQCYTQDNNGLYFGGELGMTFGQGIKQNIFTPGQYPKTQQTFGARSFYFSMPVGYEANNWLLELQPTFAGQIFMSGLMGRKICISDNVHFELLAGIADNIDMTGKPLQLIHSFDYNITGRLQIGHLFFQSNVIGNDLFVGIGFKGLARE